MDIETVRTDVGLAFKYWGELRPGMEDRELAVTMSLLASRAEPLARAANGLIDELDRLQALNSELLAACKAFERYHATDYPALEYFEAFRQLQAQMRAAIEKAE